MVNYGIDSLQAAVDTARALSDPGRVRILMALRERELCVCQVIALLGLAPSTISKHMTVLRQAGFVRPRKHGRWVYYRLADESRSRDGVGAAVTWVARATAGTPEINEDRRRLEQILETDPEELCRRLEEK